MGKAKAENRAKARGSERTVGVKECVRSELGRPEGVCKFAKSSRGVRVRKRRERRSGRRRRSQGTLLPTHRRTSGCSRRSFEQRGNVR